LIFFFILIKNIIFIYAYLCVKFVIQKLYIKIKIIAIKLVRLKYYVDFPFNNIIKFLIYKLFFID